MNNLFRTLGVYGRSAKHLMLAAGLAAVWPAAVHSQTPPYAAFQNSTLTSSVNTVTASWIPVVTTSGTVYKNLTLLFEVDVLGNVTLAPGYPQLVAAPSVTVSSFQAGKYVGPTNGLAVISVSGPGLTNGGATEWTAAAGSGASTCTYPDKATWYVGPLATTPLAARLKAAGITSTAWSYGVGSAECATSWYYNNALLGFSQIGNTISIVNFTDTSDVDHSQPVNQITYTRSQ